MTVLAIDVGGSGSRVALRDEHGATRWERSGSRAGVEAGGSTVPGVVLALVERACETWPVDTAVLDGVAVGGTGLGSLVTDPTGLARSVRGAAGAPAAVAIDAVTAHLGALAGAAGAAVVLGTGAVAVGGDPGRPGSWRRVDGWGHLLGDRGSGAQIGLAGLQAAVRAFDGVDASGSALLAAARRRFGDPATWPGQLYPRPDRAGVVAEFATDVVGLAEREDPAAHWVVATAGREAARSVVAALGTDLPGVVSLTGGLSNARVLARQFVATVADLRPDVEVRAPVGDPVDGALLLADRVAAGAFVAQEGFVWTCSTT